MARPGDARRAGAHSAGRAARRHPTLPDVLGGVPQRHPRPGHADPRLTRTSVRRDVRFPREEVVGACKSRCMSVPTRPPHAAAASRGASARVGPPSLTFDERYRAIESRDVRFDGQFVTAVRSTGIYCRPSCPARTPKPSNVTFFPTSAAAHEAGYRACKRCLPEAAPSSPDWNLRGDVAGRAMRLIADGVIEREG